MALKLLVDAATDRILGVQGVGCSGVDKRIDVIATAMRTGLNASDLADLETRVRRRSSGPRRIR